MGEVVLCTLASLTCGTPVTSTSITGPSAGVAMDAGGDCWLSTAKKMSATGPVGYSGGNPSCTMIGKFDLLGQSFYGNLNGSGAKLAVGDTSTGAVDVYNYQLPTFSLRYSFDSGLHRSRLVESGIFSPTNQRTH